jgi:hypothetical protein
LFPFLYFVNYFSSLSFLFSNRQASTESWKPFSTVAHFLYEPNSKNYFQKNHFFWKIISLKIFFNETKNILRRPKQSIKYHPNVSRQDPLKTKVTQISCLPGLQWKEIAFNYRKHRHTSFFPLAGKFCSRLRIPWAQLICSLLKLTRWK